MSMNCCRNLSLVTLLSLAIIVAGCDNTGGEGGGKTLQVDLTVSVETVPMPEEESSELVSFTASGKPAFQCTESWCKATLESFDESTGKGTAKVKVEANEDLSERTATVTIVKTGEKVSFSVIQAGSPTKGGKVVLTSRNPSSSLSNPVASSMAKSLYSYLLGIYGKGMLSGAVAGDSWDTGFSDYVSKASGGKDYPAVIAFDYLFLNWPSIAWDACPEYSDIAPVKDAFEKGSLITINWHWAVPQSKENFVNVDTEGYTFSEEDRAKLGTYDFYTSNFSVEKALTEGTWQNEVISYHIWKVAGYLGILKEAGIPVLFRPLHEAAGNYAQGAWFWWGKEGAEPYKRLWKHLYSELTSTYGLDNLIWVFTVQTGDGSDLASVDKMKEWYPGDEYVDIVGADLYETAGFSSYDFFNQVNSSVGGRKMVALCECGNLPDIEECFSDDTPWLYFLGWCSKDGDSWALYNRNSDGTYSWKNSSSQWREAMENSHTINRGDFSY